MSQYLLEKDIIQKCQHQQDKAILQKKQIRKNEVGHKHDWHNCNRNRDCAGFWC